MQIMLLMSVTLLFYMVVSVLIWWKEICGLFEQMKQSGIAPTLVHIV